MIRVQQYAGDSLEEDLAAAAYSVAREDPAGAYAVDYMTHECTLIVSYYEIHVDITFRKTQTALADIPYVSGQAELERRLHEAMDSYDSVLTIYAGFEQEPDYAALAQEYYEENLGRLMALPQITVENYPQGGKTRIAELTFSYPQPARTLESMAQQVADTIRAASVYVRFRESPWEKTQLLYSYLTERFTYTEEPDADPHLLASLRGHGLELEHGAVLGASLQRGRARVSGCEGAARQRGLLVERSHSTARYGITLISCRT